MNRWTTRLTALTGGLTAFGLILTGCSTGQISQTASQESAVNGTAANINEIALRNVYLQAVQSSDFLQPGASVPLLFVAANNSSDYDDKLVAVASDIGQVKLSGDTTIPASATLVVGTPGGEATAMGTATPITAEVVLGKPITNGLTYNFTFDFERAGRTTVAVPISAGESPRAQ